MERDQIVNNNLEEIFKKLEEDSNYIASPNDDAALSLAGVLKSNPLSGVFDIDDEEIPPLIESKVIFS